jgi:ParB family chromosome partitioning protein
MPRKALGRGLSALFTQSGSLDQDLVDISIDQIDPSDTQPRYIFNESKLEELVRSIKNNGILQPIVVRRRGERFQIVAGERRWRAAQRAGLHRVPCIVKDIPDERVLELSLIENLQREDLNPIEEANAYKKLLEGLRITQEEVARRIGKDRSTIANCLRLLNLPPEVQKLVEEGKLSMGHARALLSIESPEEQKALAMEVISGSLSVRETERLVKVARGGRSATSKRQVKSDGEDANVRAAESKLSKRLESPVRIKLLRGGCGVIEIKFSSREDLMRIFDLLMRRAAHEA